MAAGPDDLRDAILRRPFPDPTVEVFRPTVWPLKLVLGLLGLPAFASALLAIQSVHPYAIGAAIGLSIATYVWMRLTSPILELAAAGRNTWAISPDYLLYVSPSGTGTPVPLAAISSVKLNERGVPVLSLEGTLDTGRSATLSMEIVGIAAPGLRGLLERPCSPSRFVAEVERRLRERSKKGEERPPAAPPADLAPPGVTLVDLSEPIQDPNLPLHLARAKVLERCRFGRYEIVFLDARGLAVGVIKYTFRAMVLIPAQGLSVLSYNHEGSMMGTSCWGMHKGSEHLNFGEAPREVSYEAFKERALRVIGESLART